MRTVGLIGGLSWESTVTYYQHINRLIRERLGGLHSARLVVWSFDFAEVERLQAAGDWDGATALMAEAGRTLARGGAQALLICSNTMHRMADEVEAAAGVPVLHIADATGRAIAARDVRAPLLIATRYTMEQAFYRDRLADRHGVAVRTPDAADRALVHAIIYDELCQGVVRDASRDAVRAVIGRAIADGADAVIFGCTEIGLLLAADDVPAPVFDTTSLHAAAAVDFALG